MKLSADYRALALDALRGRWKTAVLAGLIASVLGANHCEQLRQGHLQHEPERNGDTRVAGRFHWQRRRAGDSRGLHPCLGSVYLHRERCGAAGLRPGSILNLADGRDAALSDLASQKHRLWDGFCMNFLQGLYVALWSLLLFIPGVVKATAMP